MAEEPKLSIDVAADIYEQHFPKVAKRAIEVCKRVASQNFEDKEQVAYAIMPVLLEHSLSMIASYDLELGRDAQEEKRRKATDFEKSQLISELQDRLQETEEELAKERLAKGKKRPRRKMRQRA